MKEANRKLRIACVQQNHNPGGVNENRAKALRSAREALEAGADIVLFHEELLIGYHSDVRTLAEPADGETTRAFRALLAEMNSDARIVYGLTERRGDQYHISAPVVSREGLQAIYRKTHLWWKTPGLRCEPDTYTPGEGLVTFEHKGGKFGLLICYDGDFPEMFRAYAKLGCDGVLWMNNRCSRGPDDGPMAAARANSLVIAATCCCGVDEIGQECPGLSHILGADGSLRTPPLTGEGMVMADVDISLPARLRKENPLYTGARFDLY